MAQAGARFETYVRAAMAETGELPTMAELYRQSGIAASTWSGWFRGVSAPRKNSMVLAGNALNRTPEQLLAAWDGERPHKARRGTETPDELVSALLRQSAAIEALVGELQLEREEGRDVVTALDRAIVRLLEVQRPGDTEGSAERSALRETVE